MTFEGISFNTQWLQSISLEQFEQEMEVNKEVWWPGDANRMSKARQVYFLVNPQHEGGAVTPPSINTDADDTNGAQEQPQPVEHSRGGGKRVRRNERSAGGPEHETAS